MGKAESRPQPDSARLLELERIEAALQEAVREALLGHKQAGRAVAVWQDNQVVWIQPEDIPVD